MKRISQKEYLERYVDGVVLPLLPSSGDKEVDGILNSDDDIGEKNNEIDKVLREYADSLEGKEIIEFAKEFQTRLEEFYRKFGEDSEKTVVHKISIDKDEIMYESSGEVPGVVLNKF